MGAAVWDAFVGDTEALEAEVRRIRGSITAHDWTGPAQLAGTCPVVRHEARHDKRRGKTEVYLLRVDGPVDVLALGIPAITGRSVCTVKRTSSLDRRISELLAGLPPTSAICYATLGLRRFRRASRAHGFERTLLDRCDAGHGPLVANSHMYS